MDFLTIVSLVVGTVCLVFGAEWLVRGASTVATKLGVAPIVVGLTVVAFGTSAPELAVSVSGAISGNADVAIGNVLGSNIYNVLGIGGVTALIAPTAVPPEIIRFDLPVMVLVSVALLALLATGRRLSRGEGAFLFRRAGAPAELPFVAVQAHGRAERLLDGG